MRRESRARRGICIVWSVLLLAVCCLGCAPQSGEGISVHYIAAGQADAILIQCGEESGLIDAGTNASGRDVVAYLRDQGVENSPGR